MIENGSFVRSKVDIKTESIITLKKGTRGVIEDIQGRHPEWGRKFSVRFEGQPYLHGFHEDELEEDTGSYIPQINTRKNPAYRSKPSQGQHDTSVTCSCPGCQDLLPVGPQSEETIRKWSEFERTLLDLGGERVVRCPNESYVSELLARGKVFTESVELRSGRPNDCHANAGELWGKDVAGTQLVNGYALKGGLWRQHSWVIREGQLVETTAKAEKYFGFVLTEVEAVRFWMVNIDLRDDDGLLDMPQIEKDWPGPMGLVQAGARYGQAAIGE